MTLKENDSFDDAMTNRLSRLRSMPIDMSALQAAIFRQFPRQTHQIRRHWFNRPLRLAASVLLALGMSAALLIATLPRPVEASPQMLAEMHQQMQSEQSMATPVTSMDAAQTVLSRQWSSAPAMPTGDGHEVMACCVHQIGQKKAACVMLKVDNTLVTMAVAKASEVRMPATLTVVRDGVSYAVQSSGDLNMVMTERNGQWTCLMGQIPIDRLITTLASLNP